MSAALKTGGDAKAMRTTKFPEEFNKKVDITKVNSPVIKKWVLDEVARLLNSDDDVVPGMIFEALKEKFPNIKKLQLDVSGFLDKDTASFCLDLWRLLLSAQADPNGIPRELLEAKKLELIQERLEEDQARAEASKRQQVERERERELAQIRERERRDRGRGRGGGGRSFERRPSPRNSRSPPRRRNGDDFYRAPPRGTDSYVPPGRGRRDDKPPARRRSLSYGTSRSRSPSRSRSGSRSPKHGQRRGLGRGGAPLLRKSRSPPSRGHEENRRFKRARRDRPFRRRSRSPPPRRRSGSRSAEERHPAAKRRRRYSSASRSRSPPRLKGHSHGHRRGSRSRSRSRSPPRRRRTGTNPSQGDLVPGTERIKNAHRLERPGSSGRSSSRSRNSSRRRGSPSPRFARHSSESDSHTAKAA